MMPLWRIYFCCYIIGWHHWLDGRESEWTPGVGEGQEGLARCDSWGRKESETTERLIWSDLIGFQFEIFPQKKKRKENFPQWSSHRFIFQLEIILFCCDPTPYILCFSSILRYRGLRENILTIRVSWGGKKIFSEKDISPTDWGPWTTEVYFSQF